MTQSEFIRIMAVRQGLSQECVRRLVGALLDSLEEGLAEGERCILRGVGTLHIVRREGGKRRNPRTGEEVEIPPHRVVRFRPSHRPVSRPYPSPKKAYCPPPVSIRQGAFCVWRELWTVIDIVHTYK